LDELLLRRVQFWCPKGFIEGSQSLATLAVAAECLA
jgi:hypothetical protein